MTALPLRATLAASVIVTCSLAAGGDAERQPASARLLVSLAGESRVILVDVASAQREAAFDVPAAPHEITLSRDGSAAFIADPGTPDGNSPAAVTVLNLAARRLRGHFDVRPRRQPHDLRVTRDGSLLWVACAPDRTVLELDAASGAVRRSFESGVDGGWFVAATPDDRTLYVPHLEGRRVTSIDRATGRIATVVDGGAQSGIDISPDGRSAWVVGHEQKKIHVIDTSTSQVSASIDLESDGFGRVRFTPDGTHVALVQDKALTLIDVRTRRAAGRIDLPLAGKVPAISPDGARLAISNPDDGRVTIVTLSPLRVEKTFEVGRTPDGIAWVQ